MGGRARRRKESLLENGVLVFLAIKVRVVKEGFGSLGLRHALSMAHQPWVGLDSLRA